MIYDVVAVGEKMCPPLLSVLCLHLVCESECVITLSEMHVTEVVYTYYTTRGTSCLQCSFLNCDSC